MNTVKGHRKVWKYSCCCSVTKSCLTFCDPMDCSMPGFPVPHHLPELPQTHIHQVGMPSNHLILSWPLLLLPSIFPSIRVFPNESKYFLKIMIRCLFNKVEILKNCFVFGVTNHQFAQDVKLPVQIFISFRSFKH